MIAVHRVHGDGTQPVLAGQVEDEGARTASRRRRRRSSGDEPTSGVRRIRPSTQAPPRTRLAPGASTTTLGPVTTRPPLSVSSLAMRSSVAGVAARVTWFTPLSRTSQGMSTPPTPEITASVAPLKETTPPAVVNVPPFSRQSPVISRSSPDSAQLERAGVQVERSIERPRRGRHLHRARRDDDVPRHPAHTGSARGPLVGDDVPGGVRILEARAGKVLEHLHPAPPARNTIAPRMSAVPRPTS